MVHYCQEEYHQEKEQNWFLGDHRDANVYSLLLSSNVVLWMVLFHHLKARLSLKINSMVFPMIALMVVFSPIVRGQFAITSYPTRYYAGTYLVSFTTTNGPVSVGTSPFSETNTNTSATFNSLIKYSSKEINKVVIIEGTSSLGDFLIFTSLSQFSVEFEMIVGFDTLTFGKRTVFIPSFGIQRFFSQRHVRKGKHNNLILMSGNVNQEVGGSQTILVGYNFNRTAPLELTQYTLSTLNYKVIEIDVPNEIEEIDGKHYVPFYLHIQCAESDLCRLVINLFNIEDDAPYIGAAFGIATTSLVLCIVLSFCVIVGSIIHKRRTVRVANFVEPQQIQTISTVQYYSPTMQPLTIGNGDDQTKTTHFNNRNNSSNFFSAETGIVYQPSIVSSQDTQSDLKK